MVLSTRELEEQDISLIAGYWESLTPDDIKRMYIDTRKLSTREETRTRLLNLIALPPSERQADPLIWEIDRRAVGLTNLNNIVRGEQASIHLHIFDVTNRGKGHGRRLFMMSVQQYLKRHPLKRLICEPASSNPHPNGLMRSLGIPVTRTYLCKTASIICFEHEVNRYEIDQALADQVVSRL